MLEIFHYLHQHGARVDIANVKCHPAHSGKTWVHPQNRKYIIQCGQKTEQRPQVTWTENFVKFRRVTFEMSERTDRQTNRQTYMQTRWSHYFAPLLRALYRRFPDNHFPGQDVSRKKRFRYKKFPGQVIIRNFPVHNVCTYQLYRSSHTICMDTERLLMCASHPIFGPCLLRLNGWIMDGLRCHLVRR